MGSESRWRSAKVLAVVGLLANVVGHVMVMTIESFFVVPGIIATVVPLVLAALVAVGPRWSLPVATLLAAIGLYTALLSPIAMARLTRVDDPLAMLAGIAEVAGLALATVAGAVGTYQAYAPRRLWQSAEGG